MFLAKLLHSHVIHFVLMGTGIALILGLLTPTSQWNRTKKSIGKYWLGMIGIGLLLAWIMYLLPRNPIRF